MMDERDIIEINPTPDLTTPEAQRQYTLRQLENRLPPAQIYAIPCIWGDLAYWMDN